MPVDLVFSEGPLHGSWMASHCVFTWRKETGSSLQVLFIRALMPFVRSPPSWPNHIPKVPPSNTIILVISFQCMNWGGYILSPWQSLILKEGNQMEVCWLMGRSRNNHKGEGCCRDGNQFAKCYPGGTLGAELVVQRTRMGRKNQRIGVSWKEHRRIMGSSLTLVGLCLPTAK